MDVATLFNSISQSLSDSDKRTLAQVAASFTQQLPTLSEPREVEQAAIATLRRLYPTASPRRLRMLAFYLVAKVAVVKPVAPSVRGSRSTLSAVRTPLTPELDSLSEINQMESLRLQMSMDRLSKLMATLSNLLKKDSEENDGLTQNIK